MADGSCLRITHLTYQEIQSEDRGLGKLPIFQTGQQMPLQFTTVPRD